MQQTRVHSIRTADSLQYRGSSDRHPRTEPPGQRPPRQRPLGQRPL